MSQHSTICQTIVDAWGAKWSQIKSSSWSAIFSLTPPTIIISPTIRIKPRTCQSGSTVDSAVTSVWVMNRSLVVLPFMQLAIDNSNYQYAVHRAQRLFCSHQVAPRSNWTPWGWCRGRHICLWRSDSNVCRQLLWEWCVPRLKSHSIRDFESPKNSSFGHLAASDPLNLISNNDFNSVSHWLSLVGSTASINAKGNPKSRLKSFPLWFSISRFHHCWILW